MKRIVIGLGAAAMSATALVPATATASPATPAPYLPAPGLAQRSADAPIIDAWLEDTLAATAAGVDLRVMVNADTVENALAAVDASGLTLLATMDRIGVAIAAGTPSQIRSAANQPGVAIVEGADRPLTTEMDTSHRATRSDLARASFQTDGGLPYDGTGVGVMVIDGGIDGTHPMFNLDGESKVKRNLEVVPLVDVLAGTDEFVIDDPDGDNNTDDVAGHGTHVAGTVGGYEVTTADGTILRGAAPGSTLYGVSVATAGSSYYGATAAQYWTLNNHADPCGDGSCAPIKSVNNSYGPIGGAAFNENSTTVEIQRQSIAEGVTYVWAAGNEGGDGTADVTGGNPKDPTPGVIMVASYDDGNTGDRDNATSDFSSRGDATDPFTWPDIAAPGSNIESACRLEFNDCATDLVLDDTDPDYGNLSGTSMASPHIAGYVAVLLQADPTLTPGEIEYVIEDTAHKYVTEAPYTEIDKDFRNPGNGETSFSSFDKGHGLVDMAAALAAVLGEPVPADTDVCADYSMIVDPQGDATALTGIGPEVGPGLPTPDVDIVAVTATDLDDAGTVVRFAIEIDDMDAMPNSRGDAVRSFFSAGGVEFTLDMRRELSPTGTDVGGTLSRPDPDDPAGVGSITIANDFPVVFDPDLDIAYADLPADVLGVAGGDFLGGVRVLWRRSFEALALPADAAEATCPLLITSSNTAAVPEGSPALFVLAGLGVLAGAAWVSRKRHDDA